MQPQDDPAAPALRLRVTRAEPVADGIRLFELRSAVDGELPPFTPGAHLPLSVPTGTGEVTRNYSLCNDPAERDRYVIAVKREEQGRGGSKALIDGTKAGDELSAGMPQNLFELDTTAPSYLFIAGGIGITPILSMIRHVMANGDKPFTLYYLTRNAQGTAFLDEVKSFGGDKRRIVVHHDEGKLDQAYDLWPVFENPTKAHIYCCGPRPLMDAVRDMTGHWAEHAVHFEDFGSDLVRPKADDVPFQVKLASGESYEVPVGATILEVIRAHGHHAPSSCESGTCGTCKTRLVSGQVDHRDLVLTDDERANHIMICVSRSAGGAPLEIEL
jgi:phthalate 4,5-dioxygenase reductase subunit